MERRKLVGHRLLRRFGRIVGPAIAANQPPAMVGALRSIPGATAGEVAPTEKG